jgi:hypothetical protein
MMNTDTDTAAPAPGLSRGQRLGPIVTLLVLAPVIGEVLSGATRLSFIFVLVPEIMVWGCGALIIRDVVRRWRGGWTSMLLLGLGLSVAEEFIIQQTSLAPLPWLGSTPAYGRVGGVNWPYFLFMLGYETVWIVAVPVQVAELIFPDRRHEAWLHMRGLVVSGGVFVVGSFVAWFLWTQRARPLAFHVPIYDPPRATIFLGALAIALLALAAYGLRGLAPASSMRRLIPAWAVAITALVLGFPWYLLMTVVFAPRMDLPLWIPVVAAGVWASAAFLLIERWSSASGWDDRHRWALAAGALLVCMVAGFLGASGWSRMDIVAKAVLNAIAVVCMLVLRARIAQRSPVRAPFVLD